MGEAKRRRGRPSLSLCADPDRFAVALYHAIRQMLGNSKSDRDISRFVAWLTKSLILDEKIAEFHWPDSVWPQRDRATEEPSFAKTLRRKIPKPEDEDGWLWLFYISTAWKSALFGSTIIEASNIAASHLRDYTTAQASCKLAGETDWFDRTLKPIIDHRHKVGPHPHLTGAALRP